MPRALIRFAFLGCLLWPSLSYANVGIPMLALAWPVQWLALIPVVLIESEVFRRVLGVPFSSLVRPLGKANVISTLVGIPVAWLVMLTLEMVVATGLSQIPTEPKTSEYIYYALFPLMVAWVADSGWQLTAAFVILTIPFCIISIYLEEGVLRRSLSDQSHSIIHTLTVRANIVSYALLAALSLLYPFVFVAK